MDNTERLLNWFFGNDPILGNQAVAELSVQGATVVNLILGKGLINISHQIESRFSMLCKSIGPEVAVSLAEAIEKGNWQTKHLAAEGYRGLQNTPETHDPLFRLLYHINVDVQRQAMMALGNLGSSESAGEICRLATANGQEAGIFYYAAIDALATICALEKRDRVFNNFHWFEELVNKLGEFDMRYIKPIWGLSKIWVYSSPIAADYLVSNWLDHQNPLLRRLACEILGAIKLPRNVSSLARHWLDDQEEVTVRVSAGWALASIGGPEAAQAIETSLEYQFGNNLLFTRDMAFSELLCQNRRLLAYKDHIERILNQNSIDPKMQIIYSVGVLNEKNYLPTIKDGLLVSGGDADRIRAAAALAVSRMRYQPSYQAIEKLEPITSTDVEKALVQAALINIGFTKKYADLHQTICNSQEAFFTPGWGLNYIWQREILSALYQSGEDGQRMANAWARLGQLDLNRMLEDVRHMSDADDKRSIDDAN